jgi:hypothetical protein
MSWMRKRPQEVTVTVAEIPTVDLHPLAITSTEQEQQAFQLEQKQKVEDAEFKNKQEKLLGLFKYDGYGYDSRRITEKLLNRIETVSTSFSPSANHTTVDKFLLAGKLIKTRITEVQTATLSVKDAAHLYDILTETYPSLVTQYENGVLQGQMWPSDGIDRLSVNGDTFISITKFLGDLITPSSSQKTDTNNKSTDLTKEISHIVEPETSAESAFVEEILQNLLAELNDLVEQAVESTNHYSPESVERVENTKLLDNITETQIPTTHSMYAKFTKAPEETRQEVNQHLEQQLTLMKETVQLILDEDIRRNLIAVHEHTAFLKSKLQPEASGLVFNKAELELSSTVVVN